MRQKGRLPPQGVFPIRPRPLLAYLLGSAGALKDFAGFWASGLANQPGFKCVHFSVGGTCERAAPTISSHSSIKSSLLQPEYFVRRSATAFIAPRIVSTIAKARSHCTIASI